MPEPGTIFVSKSWLEPLWKKLKGIRSDRHEEVQKIANDFGDPKHLARYYIEPDCQHHNPADHLEDIEPRTVVKSPVFRTINDFLQGDYAVTGGGKNQLFVLSDAGMGKTSLLVMLKLTHLLNFWPNRYQCELLRLGPETLKQIADIKHRGETILLLDGLDEDREAWGKIEQRLAKLLAATKNFHRVILSCRTQFFPETSADPFGNPGRVEIDGFVCPMLFLSLFDEDQIQKYLDKRYPKGWLSAFREERKRERAEELVGKMKDLSCRPMLLAHIEDLVDSKLHDWTESSVYGAMVHAWLLREERKLRRDGFEKATAAILSSACQLVAHHMSRFKLRFLTEAALYLIIANHPECQLLTNLQIGGRSLFNRNARGDYRFSHFSIQEYLTARCFLDQAPAQYGGGVPPWSSAKTIDFVIDAMKFHAPMSGPRPISFKGVDLSHRDLRGINFSGVDFSGANLRGCNLRSAVLLCADLRGADLGQADLSGANLSRARLDGINIEGTRFGDAVLDTAVEGINFTYDEKAQVKFIWVPPAKANFSTIYISSEDPAAPSFSEFDFTIQISGAAPNEVTSIEAGHRATEGFWMTKYVLTHRHQSDLGLLSPISFPLRTDYPFVWASYEAAEKLCELLNERPESQPLVERGLRFRLPTVDEWMVASRMRSIFQCEDWKRIQLSDVQKNFDRVAWYAGNSKGAVHKVGEKAPNDLGFHDMFGNVEEWCAGEKLVGGSWTSDLLSCLKVHRTSPKNLGYWLENEGEVGIRLVLAHTRPR